MSIVNFFFWMMLILLGLLTSLLVNASNRSEKLALAELERLERMTTRSLQSQSRAHRQHGTKGRLDQAPGNYRSTGFFTIGVGSSSGGNVASVCSDSSTTSVYPDGSTTSVFHDRSDTNVGSNGDYSVGQTMCHDEVSFDFSLPHRLDYETREQKKERAVLTDCPSCA